MFDAVLIAALRTRQQDALYRVRIPREAQLAGAQLSFCSNDYLHLANNLELKEILKNAVDDFGVGSGSSAFLIGFSDEQRLLEAELADFFDMESAVVFSSGYLANVGVISALCGAHDTVFLDKLVHASMIDGVKLSGATLSRYGHGNLHQLAERIRAVSGRKLIGTEGVFGMNGDLADLPTLSTLAREYDACLLVDDAHGIGVLGAGGRGIIAHGNNAAAQVDVLVGTFGKAFGVVGAFVAGRRVLVDAVIQFARSLIYNTALPIALYRVMRAALRQLAAADAARAHLHLLINSFRHQAQQAGLTLLPSVTPIQIMVIGDAARAVAAGAQLAAQGVLVSVIRPPTVPPNSARLRISLTAGHSLADIERLVCALQTVKPS